MILKEYISKNHSKLLIKYHIILVCKYRKQLLVGAVEYDMKKIMRHISEMSDFDIEVMETDKNHLHMMVRSEPKLSPLQIVRRLKQMSRHSRNLVGNNLVRGRTICCFAAWKRITCRCWQALYCRQRY